MEIKTKEYSNYDEYINHQKSKANHGTDLHKRLLNELWAPDCEGFRKNFEKHNELLKSQCTNALCLGARTGQEVFVLKELGLDAIGIDLVDNLPLVMEGDVHDLKFPDASYDFIFSNIFDHVLYPDKFVKEIERVIKPNGYVLLHLSINDTEDKHSANVLPSSEAVAKLFTKEIEIIMDKPLGQKDWPAYWEFFIKFK